MGAVLSARSVVGLALVLAAAGCYSATYQDPLECSAEGLCPSSLECVAGFCVKPGTAPPVDASVFRDARVPDARVPDAAVRVCGCNAVTGAGCGAGQKCAAVNKLSGPGAELCCTPNGTVTTQGSPCIEDVNGDNCVAGFVCIGAKCLRFCDPAASSNMCPLELGKAITKCVLPVTLDGEPPIATACITLCNPINQAGCTGNQSCYLTNIGPRCFSTGTRLPGAVCTGSTANSCIQGSTCVLDQGSTTTAHCKQHCTTGTATCPSPTTCVDNDFPETAANFGLCE